MSMLSLTAEYALRVAMYLGALEGVPVTIRQIHSATRIPEGYLAKVLQSLARAGIVRSQRGLHGGSVLAVPTTRLNLFDIIQAVAPFGRITKCPLGLSSHSPALCPLHKRLDAALGLVEEAFRGTTIAELLSESASNAPLCDPSAQKGPVAAPARKRRP